MPHRIIITETGLTGINSGRPRYRVICTGCRTVIHEATTSPETRFREHLTEGRSSYERPMTEGETE